MAQLEARKRLHILYEAGITSPGELINRTGISRATVYRTLEKIQAGDSLEHKSGAGRPPICDVNDTRRLVGFALHHPLSSAKEIGQMAVDRGGPSLSVRSVQNYLQNSGIVKVVPKPTIALTPEHKQKTSSFCR